jgi:hypothetical protein
MLKIDFIHNNDYSNENTYDNGQFTFIIIYDDINFEFSSNFHHISYEELSEFIIDFTDGFYNSLNFSPDDNENIICYNSEDNVIIFYLESKETSINIDFKLKINDNNKIIFINMFNMLKNTMINYQNYIVQN